MWESTISYNLNKFVWKFIASPICYKLNGDITFNAHFCLVWCRNVRIRSASSSIQNAVNKTKNWHKHHALACNLVFFYQLRILLITRLLIQVIVRLCEVEKMGKFLLTNIPFGSFFVFWVFRIRRTFDQLHHLQIPDSSSIGKVVYRAQIHREYQVRL